MFTGKKLIMADLALIIALVFAFTIGGFVTKYKTETKEKEPIYYGDYIDGRNYL